MIEEKKRTVNWLQVIAITIPLTLAMVGAWYSTRERIALLENRIIEIDKTNARIDKLSDRVDEKNSKMWEVISRKADKK